MMAVDGKWNLTINTPMGAQTGSVTLSTDGGNLTGQMDGNMGTVPIENGKADGDKVAWEAKITSPMPMTLEFDGAVDGDAISGNVKLGAFGSSTFTGARA